MKKSIFSIILLLQTIFLPINMLPSSWQQSWDKYKTIGITAGLGSLLLYATKAFTDSHNKAVMKKYEERAALVTIYVEARKALHEKINEIGTQFREAKDMEIIRQLEELAKKEAEAFKLISKKPMPRVPMTSYEKWQKRRAKPALKQEVKKEEENIQK
jgi:hypothetical protein